MVQNFLEFPPRVSTRRKKNHVPEFLILPALWITKLNSLLLDYRTYVGHKNISVIVNLFSHAGT